jgi:glycosyltransferase involved in cell wall biosynthesis
VNAAKRILLVNSTCKVGGVSTFMLALQAAHAALGHRCELFFFERGTMAPHLPAGVRTHFGTLADCLRLVAREPFDVVHGNNVDWTTGISAVRGAGATLVLTAHKARESAWTYGWTSANCDALVAVSTGVSRELQPYTDLPIAVVRNGIDTTRFSPADRRPTSPPIVAWVGRGASPLKGIDTLARIAPALVRGGVRLWIVDQHGFEMTASAFPEAATALRPLAELWRAFPSGEMPELYRAVAASGGCVLSTSRKEGLGLALLEAQACGSLAVGPDIDGVNEAVSPDWGGVLYPPHAPAETIAATVRAAIADGDALRARCLRAADSIRGRFAMERMALDYLRIYREAPLASSAASLARVRARLRLSPLLHWSAYVDQRWGVAQRQFEAACELHAGGDAAPAAAAAFASLRTAPTLYVKPRRLARLIQVMRAPDAGRPRPAWRRAARAPGRSSG